MSEQHSGTCQNQCGRCRRTGNPEYCVKTEGNVMSDDGYVERLVFQETFGIR